MKKVQIIEVTSEIGAGTRGASLGVAALKIASLNCASKYFTKHKSVKVTDENQHLFNSTTYKNAKRIDSIKSNLERVSNAVCKSVADENHFSIVLSGDHSSAYGTIAGIKKAFPQKRLGVVWIDAHADLHTPYTSPSGNMHGMPLGMALADDNIEMQVNEPSHATTKIWEEIKNIGTNTQKIQSGDVVFIGVRDTEEAENVLMKKHQLSNITAQEVNQNGIGASVEKVLNKLSHCDILYISFDVDSMDSCFSKGTGTPVERGLSPMQGEEINAMLIQNEKVICWEMVEINPTLDTENKMAIAGFKILEKVTDAVLK